MRRPAGGWASFRKARRAHANAALRDGPGAEGSSRVARAPRASGRQRCMRANAGLGPGSSAPTRVGTDRTRRTSATGGSGHSLGQPELTLWPQPRTAARTSPRLSTHVSAAVGAPRNPPEVVRHCYCLVSSRSVSVPTLSRAGSAVGPSGGSMLRSGSFWDLVFRPGQRQCSAGQACRGRGLGGDALHVVAVDLPVAYSGDERTPGVAFEGARVLIANRLTGVRGVDRGVLLVKSFLFPWAARCAAANT